jgi:hypothetical protein
MKRLLILSLLLLSACAPRSAWVRFNKDVTVVGNPQVRCITRAGRVVEGTLVYAEDGFVKIHLRANDYVLLSDPKCQLNP